MTRKVWFVVSCLILFSPIHGHAFTALYHLHKETSDNRAVLQLKTSGPDAKITVLQSAELKSQQPGEYVIKAFQTQAGVPNFSGTIPKGSTMVFSLWMKKTSDFGAMHPLAKLYLNNATGTPLCSAAGRLPLTTTLFNHTFTCITLTDIAIASQDRFYLWVGANMTAGPGANRVKAELDIEGTLNGNYDSFVGVSRHIVTSISPTSGGVGTDVTITGLNFGDTHGANMVTFNGKQAIVSSWSDTSITASVPSGVSLSTGLVTVTINGITGNGLPFSVPLMSGYITTVAGSGSTTFSGNGGPAPSAGISAADLAVDSEGNLYIAGGSRIRKVDPYGTITTIAGTGESGYSGDGGPAIYAKLNASGLTFDSVGNLYLAGDNRIRKVDRTGIITTIAGNGIAGYSGDGGPAINASLNPSNGIAIDNQGNLFIADAGNYRVRKLSTDGIITTVAGNGISGYNGEGLLATNAWLTSPQEVTIDNQGNLLISDTGSSCVRKVNATGIIFTVAGICWSFGYSGDGGTATNAKLYYPRGLAMDGANLLIADGDNHRIRKVSPDGIITTIAGSGATGFGNGGYSGDGGPATNARLNYPGGIAVDSLGYLFIADKDNYRIRKVGLPVSPVVSDISPASGSVGTSVTISGSNFGVTQGTSTVTFNGTLATPTNWSDTVIVVPVPTGATTGPVIVTINNISSNGITFTVSPKIASLSPASGPVGTLITISGYNFGATQENSTVTFNGISATPTTWNDTTIIVPVPNGTSTGPVVVTVDGISSNGVIFTILPIISSLSPLSGPINTLVTITGSNFGTSQGTSTVAFNGILATPKNWSSTSITVPVPSGATTGLVIVTINGVDSNGETFIVLTDTLTITYPVNGSVINRPDTVITGRLPAVTGEVGVTVNGQIAMVNGQDFAVNGVGLTIGENTITATMTDENGVVISTVSISVYSNTQDAYVKLSSGLEASLAPLSTQLTLDTALPSAVTEMILGIDGPLPIAETPVTFPTNITLQNSGIYVATVMVRTNDGYLYEDRFALNALDRAVMDALLKSKWEGMKGKLMSGDVATALTYFVAASRDKYSQIFAELGSSKINSIFSSITEIRLYTFYERVAECGAIRIESTGTYSYPVTFVQDENGIWKIMGF